MSRGSRNEGPQPKLFEALPEAGASSERGV